MVWFIFNTLGKRKKIQIFSSFKSIIILNLLVWIAFPSLHILAENVHTTGKYISLVHYLKLFWSNSMHQSSYHITGWNSRFMRDDFSKKIGKEGQALRLVPCPPLPPQPLWMLFILFFIETKLSTSPFFPTLTFTKQCCGEHGTLKLALTSNINSWLQNTFCMYWRGKYSSFQREM